MEALTNWAGNHRFAAPRIHCPGSLAELQALVAQSTRVRAVGSRHSFHDLADSEGELIQLDGLPRRMDLDRNTAQVHLSGAWTYGELCPVLDEAGFALPNLASLPHISIVGACSTATHGSGNLNRGLAASVSGLEIVTATGDLRCLDRARNPDAFSGAVVSLGGLGIVSRVTLDVEPRFRVQQEVFDGLSLSRLTREFEDITGAAYSVSLFTDWQPDATSRAPRFQVWLKRRLMDESPLQPLSACFDATPAVHAVHPVVGVSAASCTTQLGRPGRWYERLPHFRMDHTPSCGEELQSEYFVPRRHAVDAIQAVSHLHESLAPVLQISEIRTVAADDLWLSPCRREACVGIHFTWKPDWPAVRRRLDAVEAVLEPFEARPHWGKLFVMSRDRLLHAYPAIPAFIELATTWDPAGKFRNPYLRRHVFGEG